MAKWIHSLSLSFIYAFILLHPATSQAVCTEKDISPSCPRLASDGKCGQDDVQKYCRKSCLCNTNINTCSQEPAFTFTGPVSVEVSETTKNDAVLTAVPVVASSQCRLVGNSETMATFTARLSNSSCDLYLRPGQQLDYSKRPRYNFTLLLDGLPNCQGQDTLKGQVHVTQQCLAISDFRQPGDIAVDVSVKYAGSGRPLSVMLREDLRGAHPQFALANTRSSALDNSTGETRTQVVLAKTLDPKSLGLHRFTVEIAFCAKIENVNENNPVFLFPNATYGSTVSWHENLMGFLVKAQAMDDDAGKFGTAGLRYSILGDQFGHFTIDPKTGDISVVKALDRETVSNVVTVLVEVRDNEGTPPFNKDVGYLHVLVGDVNDNAPRFSQKTYTGEVLEVSPVGRQVLRVMAVDDDDALNAQVQYSLRSPNTKLPFSIDANSGLITVTGQLGGSVGTFSFHVTATDRGTPPLASTVSVTINVKSISSISGRRRRDATRRPQSA